MMKPLICIIEDDEGIRDVLKIILKRAGYSTTIFPDGRSVMENDFETPNLFLIDKQLPGPDGLVICEHLKKQDYTTSIPVVIMSAYPNARQLSIESGANDFIEKPFHIEDLLSTIKKHVPVSVG